MFITPGEIALAGIGVGLLAPSITLFLTHRQERFRLAREDAREAAKAKREDASMAAERSRTEIAHWRDERRKLHGDFIQAARDQRAVYGYRNKNPDVQVERVYDGQRKLELLLAQIELLASERVVTSAQSVRNSLGVLFTGSFVDRNNATDDDLASLRESEGIAYTALRRAIEEYIEAVRIELGTGGGSALAPTDPGTSVSRNLRDGAHP